MDELYLKIWGIQYSQSVWVFGEVEEVSTKYTCSSNQNDAQNTFHMLGKDL